jgi:hypothetical protein
MSRVGVVIVCCFGFFAGAARGQSPTIQPIRAAAGTVLTFHLQTLLRPGGGDALGTLPEGTILQVRLLDPIDSGVNRDGDVFRGSVVSSVSSKNKTVIETGAGVRGLFALLRSRKHPEGFRYELIITSLTDRGKTYALTASVDPALFDTKAQAAPAPSLGPRVNASAAARASSKLPENLHK